MKSFYNVCLKLFLFYSCYNNYYFACSSLSHKSSTYLLSFKFSDLISLVLENWEFSSFISFSRRLFSPVKKSI